MMDRNPPTVYLLYGDDELAIFEFVKQLRDRLGDPSTADMNTQQFEAKGLDLGDFEQACYALPFISSRRLVFLDHVDRLPAGESWRKRFLDLLSHLPPSTALVIADHVDVHSENNERKYKERSALYRWCETHPDKAYIRMCASPRGGAFVAWIRNRCQELGGEIETEAAHHLAELVVEDPRMAYHELVKLLDFVNRSRPIRSEDINQLTPFHGQSDIFAMVDAIGQRRGSEALQKLHRVLEEDDLSYAFAMIVRQFRLLIQAREALDLGMNPTQVLQVHPFVAEKVTRQARNFTRDDLDHIYHRLLAIDLGSKTSFTDREVELDSLIASLS